MKDINAKFITYTLFLSIAMFIRTRDPIILLIFLPTLIFFTFVGISWASALIEGNYQPFRKIMRIGTKLPINLQVIGYEHKSYPCIYLLNHNMTPSLETICSISLPPLKKTIISHKYWTSERMCGKFDTILFNHVKGESFDYVNSRIIECLDAGYSIWALPEGGNASKKKMWRTVTRFKTGIFYIASILGIPVVPVIFPVSYGSILMINKRNVTVKYFPEIHTKNRSMEQIKGEVYRIFKNEIENYETDVIY